MNIKKKISMIAIASMSLTIFTLLLAQAIPTHPRYGPYVDSHWWSMIIGPDSQMTALLEHEVDAGGVPRPTDIPALDAAGFTLNSMVRLGMNFLFENNNQYPCDDIAFRKAINRLVDKAALTELLYPLQSPLEYWLPPSMGEWVAAAEFGNPDYPLPQFNPGMPSDTGTDSAYSYLNDNGWTMTEVDNPWYDENSPDWASPKLRTWPGGEGVMPEIVYNTRTQAESPLYYEHSMIINNDLHQAGINTLLDPTTWSEIVAILVNTDKNDYQLMTGVGIVWSAPEPDIQYDFYKSDQFPLWNVWVYNNTDMDAACVEIKSTLDYNVLKTAVMLTQELLYRDEPMLPVMMYNTWTTFTGPYEKPAFTSAGHIGIVNQLGSGALASYNEWGKLIGQSGRQASPEEINVWYLGGYLDTLNPLMADTVPDWQLLELITGEGGQLNPYTMAYMPWGFTEEPTQVEWNGVEGHEVVGTHMFFQVREGLKWHDGTPVTADDCVFGLDLLRFQDNERYLSTWDPIYDVVKTGTYTFEVYYDMRYYFAASAVGGASFYTPKHIWEGFIDPTVSTGTGPMGGDNWTATENHHSLWRGWENSIGRDTYNDYSDMDLTELIGFGPYIYHLGGWVPGIYSHVEANPNYMATSEPLRWCPGEVNKDQYTDGRDVWHVLRRIGHEEYMSIWYDTLGSAPSLQGPAVDIKWPAQVIDMAENTLLTLHTGHWSGIGDAPIGWLKEPAG